MDLSSKKPVRRLKLEYEGDGLAAGVLKYIPIKIVRFEITQSWLNTDKELLMAQVKYIDRKTGEVKNHPIWTESYSLIRDIKDTENKLPHYTKIRHDTKTGYLLWTALNDKEKSLLLNL